MAKVLGIIYRIPLLSTLCLTEERIRQLLLFRFKNSVINPWQGGYIPNLGVVGLCPARYGLTVELVSVSKFRCTSVVTKQKTNQRQVMVIFNVP